MMKFAHSLVTAITLSFVFVNTAGVQKECYKKPRTRAGQEKNNCQGKLFIVDKKLSRVAGVLELFFICLRHRDELKKADNRCSFPSHAHSDFLLDLPERLYNAVDWLGRQTNTTYTPGTKWCTNCRKHGEKLLCIRAPEHYVPPVKRKVCVT